MFDFFNECRAKGLFNECRAMANRQVVRKHQQLQPDMSMGCVATVTVLSSKKVALLVDALEAIIDELLHVQETLVEGPLLVKALIHRDLSMELTPAGVNRLRRPFVPSRANLKCVRRSSASVGTGPGSSRGFRFGGSSCGSERRRMTKK